MKSAAVNAPVALPEWVYASLPGYLAEGVRRAEPYLRSPEEVMAQAVMHGMVASNQSFAQSLVRRMVRNRWKIELIVAEVNPDSTGFMAYGIDVEGVRLTFGVFIYPPFPPDAPRRRFADTKAEFLGVLMQGDYDRERLFAERDQFDNAVWWGRSDSKVLAWTLGVRGSRTFEQVVESLVHGEQPKRAWIDDNGGYILRNGGFYGNGRMGTAAWTTFASRVPAFSSPYHADMFGLYLWRVVSCDLVDATAKTRNADAAALTPEIRRHVGMGNSSGMGTVAALIRWPARTSSFILAREVAFAYAKSQPMSPEKVEDLVARIANMEVANMGAPEADPELIEPRPQVCGALGAVREALAHGRVDSWDAAIRLARESGSIEAAELIQSQLAEVFPETEEFQAIIDTGASRSVEVRPDMTIAELREILQAVYGWAVRADLEDARQRAYFWYRSEENGENRRGERAFDLGVERETFIDVAGTAKRLHDFLVNYPQSQTVGRFLLEAPEFTQIVARAQFGANHPYSEVCESVTSYDFLVANGIRAFLVLLGIEEAMPHSLRWVRGLFYRGAPLPEDLLMGEEKQWGIGSPSYEEEQVEVAS
jgi:hypothetical protein